MIKKKVVDSMKKNSSLLLLIMIIFGCVLSLVSCDKENIGKTEIEEYNIIPDYNISYIGFSKGNVIQDGKQALFLKFSSDYNVIKMNASGHLLDISGAVIYDFSTVTIATNSKNPEIHIREDYSIIQSTVNVIIDNVNSYTNENLDCNIKVSIFDHLNNKKIEMYKRSGENIAIPNIYLNKLYKNDGWYTESEYVNRYDFKVPVTEDVSLYMKASIDFEYAKKYIENNYSKSVVTVIAKSTNQNSFGITTSSSTKYGVGIVYKIKSNECHVIVPYSLAMSSKGYTNVEYEVVDANERKYVGYSGNKNDPNYNLSTIFFLNPNGVEPIPMNNNKLEESSYVVDYSYRNTTANTLSLSNVSYVDSPSVKFNLRVEPSIPFKVLRYECGFDSPFKGGIVFDDDLRFVGLSYYGEKINDKNYVYAIPFSEIYNYLYV